MNFKRFLVVLALLVCHPRPTPALDSLFLPDIEVYMQIGSASEPHLLPDGQTVFFTSWLTGVTQLYRVDAGGGWPIQLTFFPDGIDFYSPSPSGEWVVVGASRGGDEQSQLYLVDAQSGRTAQLTDMPKARFGRPVWSPDETTIAYRSNQLVPKDFYIYTMDIESGSSSLVFKRNGYNTVADWSFDGRKLLVLQYISNVNTDLYLLDLEKGDDILLTPHRGEVIFDYPHLTHDGKGIYLMSNSGQDRLGLAYLELTSKRLTYTIEENSPWDLEELSLSEDGRFLAWIVNEEGFGRLKLYDLDSKRMLPSPPMEGICTEVTFSNDGKVAFAFTSPTRAADVWVWDWQTPELTKVTHSVYAGIDPHTFVEPELIRYPSFDGRQIPAFLYLPADYIGERIPFIVHVHGGPESQFRPTFFRHFQYLLHRGYGVLAPNIRGSSGYGKSFAQLDDYKRRPDAVRDVEQAARWLIDSGYTDPSMLAIKGASYGGYMTLAALTTYPKLFAAGIDEIGIANFVTFLERTKPYRRALREAEYGPLSDAEFLRKISPLTYARRIEAPLLIVHGQNDPRVPIFEARQIAEAIRHRGGTVDTLFFPDEGHGVGKLSNRLVMYRRLAEFLDHHLKGEG